MKESDISVARLHELLRYEDGKLYWKVRRGGKAIAGSEAGSIYNHGYIVIGVDKALLLAHRIIWAMHTGSWPELNIDHIDGVKTHNIISNLREVSQLINGQNRALRSSNKSGEAGIYQTPTGSWHVDLRVLGERVQLGTYKTLEEAKTVKKDYVETHSQDFTYIRDRRDM